MGEQLGLNMAAHWGYALAGILLTVGGAEAVWGGGKFDSFSKFGEYTGRPVGEGQKWCAHYYGKHGGKDGWANWEESNCTAPFNDVCVMLAGQAEITHHNFEQRYLRSCHFRCPCNESLPWELHGIGESFDTAVNMTWNKRCTMLPPTEYALSSPTYKWPAHKEVSVMCCKKYHYPKITDPDKRFIFTDRGEACNMWIVDSASRTARSTWLSVILIAAVIRYLSQDSIT